ncbi:hypothetical protein [Xenorhabdus bovienii]|uniref:hypothetical protein n=1 Tax=Xenorhabdus bovienii TaxID=40576 RepID=UPI0012D30E18|nr:hypothetical protein [Xenorhabdus bovienii]
MCRAIDDNRKCDDIKAKLLEKIERLELAANRGKHLAALSIVFSDKGSSLANEVHEATIKNCQYFKEMIDECLESGG